MSTCIINKATRPGLCCWACSCVSSFPVVTPHPAGYPSSWAQCNCSLQFPFLWSSRVESEWQPWGDRYRVGPLSVHCRLGFREGWQEDRHQAWYSTSLDQLRSSKVSPEQVLGKKMSLTLVCGSRGRTGNNPFGARDRHDHFSLSCLSFNRGVKATS